MGSRRGPYHAEFPIGTIVTIKPFAELEGFRRDGQYHHPLLESQPSDPGKTARVWRSNTITVETSCTSWTARPASGTSAAWRRLRRSGLDTSLE
jgi:hypothetical protein